MRPSTGVVLPRCRVPVQVIQVPDGGDSGTPPRGGAARTPPPNPGRDKFLVQAVRMPNIEGDSAETAQELFSRAGGQHIQELKLRVHPAVPGADSPAPSPGDRGGGRASAAGSGGGGTPSRGSGGGRGGADRDPNLAPGSPSALPKSVGGQVMAGKVSGGGSGGGGGAVYQAGTRGGGGHQLATGAKGSGAIAEGFSMLHLLLALLVGFFARHLWESAVGLGDAGAQA